MHEMQPGPSETPGPGVPVAGRALYTAGMIHARESRWSSAVGLALVVAVVVASLLVGGCSSYRAPTLMVTGAAVTERTDRGTVLGFTLDAENPNAVELPLREVRYTLELEGERVFEGFRSPEATIRRFAVQHVTLPAVVSAADASRLGLGAAGGPVRYRLSGTLTYLTPGEIEEILFDNEIRRPTVSFAEEGVVALTAAPTVPAARAVP